MYNPVSTYRIQFHKGFTFSDLEKIIPYLSQLGVKTIYASPIFEAVPGSMHGYDVTDPLNINPEIGTLQQLRSISKKLQKLGIGWLQDIVPNHMAFHPNNRWLMDVLENGRESEYANFFDIFWDSPVHNGKLMVPFLGKSLDEVIANKELKVVWNEKPMLDYFGQQYPLNRSSYENNTGKDSWVKKVKEDAQLLKQVVEDQYYELCFWQETDKRINFRRFFTVSSLICLNIQREEVFDRYHQLIKKLLDEGIFQGLRVDHIDGLYDPKTYLERLRELAGPETYIVVEKILEEGEQFPADWPVQGNTGYDFLSTVNNLFTSHESRKIFSNFYKSIETDHLPVHEQVFEKKRLILDNNMQGELENLRSLFTVLKLADDSETKNISPEIFKKAIAEILVRCPVYRFYGNSMPLNETESAAFNNLLIEAGKNIPELISVTEILGNCLLHKPRFSDEDYKQRALIFYQRLMQFTGPLMAKGVEDTLMYTYNRFVDHNEVGDSPGSFGLNADKFHELMLQRQTLWPLSMNASATHDTKRGEDVRARLNVLSDLAEEWIAQVKQWQQLDHSEKTNDLPDTNDEYFIYQTLIGAYPMPDQDEDDFENRLKEYLAKALREAKMHTNWAQPNEEYEQAAIKFAISLLNKQGVFWKSFEAFHRRIADLGIINSLAQVLLKYTCTGMPDLYQGGELWDLSLVDPDNRRPVDYSLRQSFIDKHPNWEDLWDNRHDGHIKQKLTAVMLKARLENADVFSQGEYVPLKIKGKYKEDILAFARHFNGKWYLSAVPLHFAAISTDISEPAHFDWDDTRIVLPESAPFSWKNLLTGKAGYSARHIPISEIFAEIPLAFLRLQQSKNKRSAGVLMHITSLPSSFGIGDIGPQAYRFADFLSASRQRIWQMLPVNPIDAGSGYSPYSATSAMAGNVLLISPELLVNERLLDRSELTKFKPESDRVNYPKAVKVKAGLFDKAYQKFLEKKDRAEFEDFKRTEAWWLDDFAAYQFLKDKFGDSPWNEWPDEFKFRDARAMENIAEEQMVDQIKWLQFVFTKQWAALKKHCNAKDIILLGDMSFYISYDSVDVWSNPQLFKIDDKGNITGVAGVPPDYFSKTGQLWGMPVYNWDKIKADNYDWWEKRIKRNLQFFDLIRMDHFRAFSAYWEVPGGSTDATHGKWQPGPGADFFNHINSNIGRLPFVAEDLGDIDEAVYCLRDQFNLPGMRVLQFAFDSTMPVSEHIPHNYTRNSIAYTGTHDNNTIKSWFEDDVNHKTQKRIQVYAGRKVSGKNINKVMVRMCYASAAKTVIIPMQDILGLDSSARMNIPSSPTGNWTWQLTMDSITPKTVKNLQNLCIEYNR